MSAGGVKRMRGLAVHRAIIIGNTATPLTELERMSAPPDHTHKWTVAVRSAASHPLPTISGADQLGLPSNGPASASGSTAVDAAQASSSAAPGATANAAGSSATGPGAAGATGGAGMSTRGRDYETDYHKMVGGKDDISHFIKRVQFKLHETYPQSTRNIDKPPFQVTETGWGEFDIQIKIFFVAESGEKPISTFHRLKLHPWHPIAVPAPEAGLTVAAADDQMNVDESTTAEQATSAEADAVSAVVAEDDIAGQAASEHQAAPTLDSDATLPNAEQPLAINGVKAEVTTPAVVHETRSASAAALPLRNVPAFVHSWSYDEIVFPEPTEAFYEILTANVPTPLAIQSAQAFSEPSTFRKYKLALEKLNESSGTQGRDIHAQSGILPPHPLYDATGATFDALSQEAMLAEGQRLDKARQNAVAELEESRRKLIECESRLRQYRPRPAPTST